MKHVSLTILVIALMTSMVAYAKDADAPPSVDLKLSKTLTLNPSGTPPVIAAPVTGIDAPAASLEKTDSVLPWAALLALLVLPVGYWLGRRQQQRLMETTLTSKQDLNEQVLTLKDALTESSSGPRNEWQSSLTSLQSELREKSKYIDQMHDQSTANTKIIAELEEAFKQQVELTEGLDSEHQATLNEQVGKIQQLLDKETQTTAEKLEQRAQLTTQQLDEQSKLGQQALDAKSEEMQQHLDEQSSEARLQFDNLGSVNKTISAERDAFKNELEQSEATVTVLSEDHDRLTTELESAVATIGPQAAQIKQLSSELDDLQTSNDISVSELKKYVQENVDLSQSLEQTREESQRLQILLNQAKQEAKEHLVTEQKKLSVTLEAEQLAFSQRSNQQVEEFKRKIEGLEKALEDRELELTAVKADFAHTSESETVALDELNQAHTVALTELSAKTEHVFKLEEVLKKSKVQLDHFETTKLELDRKEAELAQIQSIAVDTEKALNEARSALSDQTQALDQQARSKKSIDTENTARLQEIEHLKAQLATVTERAQQETQRANETQETQQALQDKLVHQEQDTAVLLDSLQTLESEHERQNRLVSTLEGSVEQLESDLSEREEENTHTMKQLAQVADHTAELEARIESHGLLDSHIQELESQLVSEQDDDETAATQQFLVAKPDTHATELQHELKALKTTLDNQTQTNEHLKKTLEQARKYREELEENTRDLERENRDLSKAGTNSRQELQISHQALQDSVQKIGSRDQKLQELHNTLESTTKELASSKTELRNLFTKVDELTASVALMESNTDEANTRELSDKLDRTRKELNQSAQILSETKAMRNEHERNASALQEQLTRSQEQLGQKKERTNILGTQLLELSEQRDKNLKTIASLEQALDAIPLPETPSLQAHATASEVEPDENYGEAMRARENIIAALEHELHNADTKIAGLNQKLEDYQFATRAETREDEPDDEPISSAELEKLKLTLMNKTRLIQALSNDVKVNRDLVRVFENDSNMLHDTEVKLESLEEHSQFLEHELAKAVTENKTLKSEIEKAAKRLARHQNIGRTVSEDTRLEQLKSRLNLLESENRQQLEVIAQLRDRQDRPA